LYNLVKQKFENDTSKDVIDIFLEITSKDNTVIFNIEYIGCEIDNYVLGLNDNEPHTQSIESDNIIPYEQFFFKCKEYSVNFFNTN